MKAISINFKRFDKTIPLPVFKTKGAVAADMYSRLDMDIAPNELVEIPLNVAIEIPDGYCIFLISRSSTHKFGIRSVNGVGVFDNDYCGDDDEYRFIVYNYTDKPVHIDKGSRVAQILLVKKENFVINELDNFKHNPNRGGIGSTGIK